MNDTIIFDLDGTLANNIDRNKPYNPETLEDALLNIPIFNIYLALEGVFRIVILTSRGERHRQKTEDWLAKWHINYEELIMRQEGDKREGHVIKKEIFEKWISGKYKVLAVFDDRDSVVKMWRELGVTCLQVAEGDY